jgi:hypothetical protein
MKGSRNKRAIAFGREDRTEAGKRDVKKENVKKLDGIEGASWAIPESDQIRARGLARLLCYALLDAEVLGCESATESIRTAIDCLKATFDLTDSDLVRSDRTFMD